RALSLPCIPRRLRWRRRRRRRCLHGLPWGYLPFLAFLSPFLLLGGHFLAFFTLKLLCFRRGLPRRGFAFKRIKGNRLLPGHLRRSGRHVGRGSGGGLLFRAGFG